MPKPLFHKLVVQAAISFFCILFGCAFAFRMHDTVFLIMSLFIGSCCLVSCFLLYQLIHRQEYLILSGTCTGKEVSALKKTQQIHFTDVTGTEQVFIVAKHVKLLQGHTYDIYFCKPRVNDLPLSSVITDGFLGFEEISTELAKQ